MQEGLGDQLGVEEAPGRHRTVPEHDEVPPGGDAVTVPDLREQLRDGVQEPLPVGQHGPVHGVGRVRVLGHGVEEGAAAETGGPDPVHDGPRDGPDLPVGSRTAAPGRGHLRPDAPVGLVEVGEDQVVLAREVPVQRGAGDLRLRGDPVDADGVDALGVEDPRGGAEQPGSRFGGVRAAASVLGLMGPPYQGGEVERSVLTAEAGSR